MTASFFTLEPGTPVVDRFGLPAGTVSRVLVAYGEHFDGVVVATPAGDRFVDAPEVIRIGANQVELAVTLSDVVAGVRHGRVDATEDDRERAVQRLKAAFAEDAIGVEELERRIELVHEVTRLRDLDRALADVL